MTPRTVADLTPADCGRQTTLTGPDWSITGTLWAVRSDTDWIDEADYARPNPRRVPTRTKTHVQVGPFTALITSPTSVTVQEPRP